MNRTKISSTVVAITFLVCAACMSRAQGVVFNFPLWDRQPGFIVEGGFGSLTMDSSNGHFQVNVLYPYDSGSFTPLISTPSGSLAFLLGTGTPAFYPDDGGFGDGTTGVRYAGSFQSSPAIYSDLLSGLGQFQLSDDSGVQLSGAIIETVPEPAVSLLFVCGLSLLFVSWARPNKSPEPL